MLVKYLRFLVKNYLFAVISLIFTIMYWLSARTLPEKSLTFSYPVLICLIPIFIWNFVKSVMDFRKTVADQKQPEEEKWNCTLHITKPKVIVTLITIAYVALMKVLGFLPCTVLYLAALAWYLGIRQPKKLLLFTVGYTAVIWLIFDLWLNVRLPEGIFF